MPRKERYPYSHHVNKTRKEHKCVACGKIIPKGSTARYKNGFDGKRMYIHCVPDCDKFKLNYTLPAILHNSFNLEDEHHIDVTTEKPGVVSLWIPIPGEEGEGIYGDILWGDFRRLYDALKKVFDVSEDKPKEKPTIKGYDFKCPKCGKWVDATDLVGSVINELHTEGDMECPHCGVLVVFQWELANWGADE